MQKREKICLVLISRTGFWQVLALVCYLCGSYFFDITKLASIK